MRTRHRRVPRALPAATSALRDMTDVRFEVPEFVPDLCTGCSQCWVQCPDAAIPGIVTTIDGVIDAAVRTVENGQQFNRMRQLLRPLTRETNKVLKGAPFTTFADSFSEAYQHVTDRLDLDPDRRRELDEQFSAVHGALTDFPLAKTAPFFDAPEAREAGTGGMLSITINPSACKGCNICVEVCPDDALKTVKQDEDMVNQLRRNWELWEHLPDTPDHYIRIPNLEEGVGVLSSLLLKKDNYTSMFGGDGACMGCGEKTSVHLVLSAVNALMLPRVEKYLMRLDGLIDRLDARARTLLTQDADLEALVAAPDAELSLDDTTRAEVDRLQC